MRFFFCSVLSYCPHNAAIRQQQQQPATTMVAAAKTLASCWPLPGYADKHHSFSEEFIYANADNVDMSAYYSALNISLSAIIKAYKY